MLTFMQALEAAQKYVSEHYGQKCVVSDHLEREHAFGFWYTDTSKTTGEIKESEGNMGGDGIIVLDKRHGKIWKYNSSLTIEAAVDLYLEEYREIDIIREDKELLKAIYPQFQYNINYPYKVIIENVYDIETLVELLDSYDLQYKEYGVEHSTVMGTIRKYTKELLRKRLSGSLPVEFVIGGTNFLWGAKFHRDCKNRKVCSFRIEGYVKRKIERDPAKATTADLATEW